MSITEFSTVYSDVDVGNGDPFVVMAWFDEKPRIVESIGTGFTSYDNIIAHVEHAIGTGEPTARLPPEVAEQLEGASEVKIFELGATVTGDV